MSGSNLPLPAIFGYNYGIMRQLCMAARPDRAAIGSSLLNLVSIIDDFPACEQPRYLAELHHDVIAGEILDLTWGPTVEFAIVTRILQLGDPPNNQPFHAVVDPLLLAYMHERYAYIVTQFPQLGSRDTAKAHLDRAFKLRHPWQHHSKQLAKQASKTAVIYLMNRSHK